MARSPGHKAWPKRSPGCPGFGRKWIGCLLECWLCGKEAIHVFPCKLQKRGGEILFHCACGGSLHHVYEDDEAGV